MSIFEDKKNEDDLVISSDTFFDTDNSGWMNILRPERESELAEKYDIAFTAMEKAFSEAAYLAAAERFKEIAGFRDADELAEECLRKAESSRKDAVYAAAKAQERKNTLSGYKAAIGLYQSIPGWKDADQRQSKSERLANNKRTRRNIGIFLIFAAVLAVAVLVLYTSLILPGKHYRNAKELYEAGRYKEALSIFKDLGGFRDSEDMIRLCETAIKDIRYDDAVSMMNEGRYRRAIVEFTLLDEYKDSGEKLSECRYYYGTELFETGRFKDAFTEFIGAYGFRDSKEKADEAYIRHRDEELKTADVGDSVLFGMYEQDDDESDGKEYIEWLVLEKTGDSMFVISVYALDCLKYNSEDTAVTWETSSVRTWLNESFLNRAFNSEEQLMIQETTVTADTNPEYLTPAGKDTVDKVFLLSSSEVEEYTSLKYARRCEITEYCIAQGAYSKSTYSLSSDDICWWWLRSPGKYPNYAAYTLTDGSVFYNGRIVSSGRGTVRPALRIKLGK